MRHRAAAIACLLTLVPAVRVSAEAPAGAQAPPDWYVKKATARQTYEASLAARQGGGAETPDAIVPGAAGTVPRGIHLGPWHWAGPFPGETDKDFNRSYPMEQLVDLRAAYPGLDGKPVGWKSARFKDGEANNLGPILGQAKAAAYLYRTISVPKAAKVPVSFGSDDSLAVWLNGRKVLSRFTSRGVALGDDRATLALVAGENHLLMKVANNGGGEAGFAFALGHTGAAPAPAARKRGDPPSAELFDESVLREVARDFPPAEVHRLLVEFDWMRWDGLRGPAPDYQAAAAKALDLAKRTLAAVSARRALPTFAAELAKIEALHAAAGDGTDWRGLYFRTRWLRRVIAMADPLLDCGDLLAVKRGPTLYSHMCDQYLGRHSQAGPGLVVLSDWRTVPKARPMLPEGQMPPGAVHHPDLSYDGKRVVFGFCPHTEQDRTKRWFYLWEAAVDGSWVRQLTGVPGRDNLETHDGRSTVYVEDWDPCYLPGGDIMFISTRNQAFGRCHGGRYTPAYVLYRCDPNGDHIRRISWGEANEWDPSVLHDGSVVYTRWDYINRHDTIFQSLWTTRPDGTAVAHYYGNNSRNPCMIGEARSIPGTHKIVATAQAHHSYTTGSIMVIDNFKGLDGLGPITRITPETPFPEGEGGRGTPGTFCSPWPLSEEVFLAAYQPDAQAWQGRVQRFNAYGLYLVDTLGGRELVYRDLDVSTFSPIPIRARPVPPALPTYSNPAEKDGIFVVQDVYNCGRGQVPAGKAKYLRVVGIIEQPKAGGAGRSAAANEIVKYVMGTVPIEPDGSAAFRAPAKEPLLFQLLDENYMSLMSMRSQAYLQPGERMGCVGCHEPTASTPAIRSADPGRIRTLTPPPWPANPDGFNFARTVQPVLDRHCIGCHGLSKEAPFSLVATPGRFLQSYDNLVAKGGVKVAHRNGETHFSVPMDYGSHASKLAGMLLAGHPDKGGKVRVRLDPDGLQRLVTWLDLNAQYCGDYYGNNRPERGKPDPAAETQLRDLLRRSGGPLAALAEQPVQALVNLAAPDESRALEAPLAAEAGGWGQAGPVFRSRQAPEYQALRRLVMKAAGRDEQARADAGAAAPAEKR